ncbi:MAG: PadR family transcriptional regulator [Chloroflexi bacterium]|nr:PadR family transcriptional regulator [Chloroflexota bacterium]
MFNRECRHKGQGFLGWPAAGRPFHRGDFKYIILQCIKDKPSYGYEIIRALRERYYSFYIPSPGSVYPTLQMLDEMGYAKATEQEGKKVYSITEEGRKVLEEQKEFVERMKGPMRRGWQPENMDDFVKTRRQFEKLTELLRDKARTADAEKLGRIRKVLSNAYEEILKD